MSSVKRFGILPSMAILALSVGLINHVLIGPLLLDAAGRDAWLAVFVSLGLILPWGLIPFMNLLNKLKHKRIDYWLKDRLPPFLVWLIMAYFLLIMFMIATETLVVTTSWSGTTYLPRTPNVVLCLVFVCLCMYAALNGLRTIAFMSCILIPFVVLLGDFVMTTNMPHKDYRYLLPMLENGAMPVIKAVVYLLTSFSELFYILLFQHHLSGSYNRKHMLVLVLFLALLALGPVAGAIAEFGPVEAEKMRYPAFSQWRLVSIGKYFEHVDFFAIYQWLSGALIRTSLAIYLILEYSGIKQMKRQWLGVSVLGAALTGIAYYWVSHMVDYREVILWVYTWFGILTMSVVLVVYAISFMKARRGGNERQHHRSGNVEENRG
ncbi:GerAB/ArcD/ProY family transporter [Paenibacillus soyae]|uniref:Endospore germination permease n=1 Tax=Paenibacillus soyae TaxID=2969249 RepID=A0A9X2MRA9_9BACL|nr:endospore germination permease [Paenibacillus soyae]MCR2802467.1 endospore germination permease [Paenibacillus soyae]